MRGESEFATMSREDTAEAGSSLSKGLKPRNDSTGRENNSHKTQQRVERMAGPFLEQGEAGRGAGERHGKNQEEAR